MNEPATINDTPIHWRLINRVPLDPAPRSYPPLLTLKRRSKLDTVPSDCKCFGDIERWLLEDAIRYDDLLELFQSFVWRLLKADLPVNRASLHLGTLHPELIGYMLMWNSLDGLCDEVQIVEQARDTELYRTSPLYRVVEHGEMLREKVPHTSSNYRYPVFAELAEAGLHEYVGIPLHSGGEYHNAVTIATEQNPGFTDEQLDRIIRLFRLFALHVERHIASRISENALVTYLGEAAGSQVLHGSIKRGYGNHMQAIIWFSDLRGFTRLADQLDDHQTIAILNEYFNCFAGAVIAQGGEVLKYIGDGLLAVFAFDRFKSPKLAAEAAMAAANAALNRLGSTMEADLDQKALEEPAQPSLQSGIALHRGDVFFGNVGATNRLDFTVIGKAVNVASRVADLCKSLDQSLLVTDSVHELLDNPACSAMGTHTLRGIKTPVELFSIPA